MKENKFYLSKNPLQIMMLSVFLFFLVLACGNGSDKTKNDLKSENPSEKKQIKLQAIIV